MTFAEYVAIREDGEAVGGNVVLPPGRYPPKKKKRVDQMISGYPVPDQISNQLFPAQTRIAGGY